MEPNLRAVNGEKKCITRGYKHTRHPSTIPVVIPLRGYLGKLVGSSVPIVMIIIKNGASSYIKQKPFLDLAYHETIGVTPYQMMFSKPPPREITDIIKFPEGPEEELNLTRVYNRILHKIELRRRKQDKTGRHIIKYEVGEKILIKNRQQPSGAEGIAKKLLLLYNGPFLISKDNQNNTYVIIEPNTNKIKGTYNQTEIKKIL